MQELELVSAFYERACNTTSPASMVEKILQEEFFPLSSEQKSIYLTNLLNGLMQFDVSVEILVAIYKGLMNLDGYERDLIPLVTCRDSIVLECTGSGKKPQKTLNISTPSILTAVAAGAKIIKKGSSATSSVIGSADLIYGLGLKTTMTLEEEEQLLYNTGFTFVNIEKVIPRFNSIYNGHFYRPHLLSLVLAADVTSLRGNKIIYGLSNRNVYKSCQALTYLNNTTEITVYASTEDNLHYYDEVIGKGKCHLVRNAINSSSIEERVFDCNTTSPHEIKALESQKDSIQSVISLLKNHPDSAYTDVICQNASFYLKEAGIVNTLEEGKLLSKDMLYSHKAYNKLLEIIESSGGHPSWYVGESYGYI